MCQSGGTCYTSGEIAEYTMTGGTLENDGGYIETLYYAGGRISGRGNIGKMIDIDAADAGADEGYIDGSFSDDAGWQDADWDNGDFPIRL